MSIQLRASALLVTALSLHAHGAETLFVGGPGGSSEEAFKTKVIPAFEQRTGTKVVYVSGNSTDLLAKLQAQKESRRCRSR